MGFGTSFDNAESHATRKPPTSMRLQIRVVTNRLPVAAATSSHGGFRVTWDIIFIDVVVVITVAW
jgi:hypothetical protein